MDKWVNELRKQHLYYFHPVSFTFLKEWNVGGGGEGLRDRIWDPETSAWF